jgi:hypothetical protein
MFYSAFTAVSTFAALITIKFAFDTIGRGSASHVAPAIQ